jgi:DNA topoisomerase-2
LNWAKFKADRKRTAASVVGEKLPSLSLFQSVNRARKSFAGLPKLSDANNAGTKKGSDCTLILTEGDFANTFAVAGLAAVGQDDTGVFPLHGESLIVREAKHDQIMKNEEIQNIKFAAQQGIPHLMSMRYGQLMIMADQVSWQLMSLSRTTMDRISKAC